MIGADDVSPADHAPHPSWVIPTWMLLALFGMFVAGFGCGAGFMALSRLGPLGPGDGPPAAGDRGAAAGFVAFATPKG